MSNDILMRFEKGKAKAFTMSFDDGRLRDADIIKALQKNKMKATFFLANGVFGKSQYIVADGKAAKALYGNTGMEIAGHTVNHRDLPTVFEQEGEQGLKAEIVDNITALEEIFDQKIIGLSYSGAPPYKLYDDNVIQFAKNNGVCYARGVAKVQNSFAMPQDWLVWGPTTWVGNVGEIESLTKQFLEAKVTDDVMLYNIWGHAYDIDDKWESFEAFEQFCKNIGNRQDVWYATYGEIYCYAKAFEKLSVCENKVTNNSDQTLWFDFKGKNYEIKAKQTMIL